MILILDFGSQYTQLIARRIREFKVYCEIYPYSMSVEEIRKMNPSGIVLSGGPSSVYDENAPKCSPEIFELGIPVLGICYGLQLLVKLLGGKVHKGAKREYGLARLNLEASGSLFDGLENKLTVWMSHGDEVDELPPDFVRLGYSDNAKFAAVANTFRKIYGLQFHPEVRHTPQGSTMISNFLFKICGAQPDWTMESFVESAKADIRAKVNGGTVLCALSGGVDSSVVAALIHEAVKDQLRCVFVDNGVLRAGEIERMRRVFGRKFNSHMSIVPAGERFLNKLSGVVDPEKKRKIIGEEFIRVFEEEAKKMGPVQYLAQGTLYPDVIESVSVKGPSAVIKSHHNVGGLPKDMNLKLLEPLRFLFKDEVRALGRTLGLPEEVLGRHPFPGPGMAVRILGEVTAERLDILRKADLIVEEEIRKAGLYETMWQAFGVLLPVKTVGVMGDERTYENVFAVRAVDSSDGMTADWVKLPYPVLASISSRVINEVRGINRVVYDISSKPPATIEWE